MLLLLGVLTESVALAADIQLPGLSIELASEAGRTEVATAIKVLIGLTVLSLAPGILVMATSFTRIIVVLAMLRQAFGTQETPPNSVLISLALFLTFFSMAPVIEKINSEAWGPWLAGQVTEEVAFQNAVDPIRSFMAAQTREKDIALMIELSGSESPRSFSDVKMTHLIPAFMLSELKSAFQIGFVIFLPFLLIDLVVASVLMSMGMLMVPPMMISMPVKVLMFVLIDGWNLVVRSLLGSFL
ncbi:MAG TPA: flagellar type III secretion system pore protein FliP [Gammaproteobacteria bacterium]|nr:flagellar type III secretion system pore protein FliP [Gammaproteobacteria bacterium]